MLALHLLMLGGGLHEKCELARRSDGKPGSHLPITDPMELFDDL